MGAQPALEAGRLRNTCANFRNGLLRFTPDEIEGFRKLGLDFDGARTQDDVEQVLTRWADTLNDERPDLLDKIAAELARTKGVHLPARLTRVR